MSLCPPPPPSLSSHVICLACPAIMFLVVVGWAGAGFLGRQPWRLVVCDREEKEGKARPDGGWWPSFFLLLSYLLPGVLLLLCVCFFFSFHALSFSLSCVSTTTPYVSCFPAFLFFFSWNIWALIVCLCHILCGENKTDGTFWATDRIICKHMYMSLLLHLFIIIPTPYIPPYQIIRHFSFLF